LLGILAAGAILVLEHTAPLAWGLAVLLPGLASLLALAQGRAHQAELARVRAEAGPQIDYQTRQLQAWEHAFERLAIELFPILVRYIEHARQLTEQSITQLSHSFSALVSDLEAVIATTQSDDPQDQAVLRQFEQSRATLKEVIADFESILHRESSMIE